MKMHIAGLVSVLSLVACGGPAEEPQELKSARDAYTQASTGAGQQYAAPAVIEAKTALDEADATFKDKGPDAIETKDSAYVATRKAQLIAQYKAEGLPTPETPTFEATHLGQ